MMHSNIPQTDWKKVKSEIQKTWSALSGDDLEKTRGDVRAISGLVQKKYGIKKEEAEKRLDEVIDRCGTAAGAPMAASSKQPGKGSSQGGKKPHR